MSTLNVLYLFPRKIRRCCRVCLFLVIFFAMMFYIHSKLNESEKSLALDAKHLRNYQHRKNKFPNSNTSKNTKLFHHPNAIEPNEYHKNVLKEYKNSESLVQKLKPKLKKPVKSTYDDNNDELWASELGAAKNDEELKFREEGYNNYAFNTLVSLRLGLSRELPDTRHTGCKKQVYHDKLPSASIIICYYHEEINVLLRTIHSVLERTPATFLKEILIINDQSDIDISQNVSKHIGMPEINEAVQY